MQVYYILKTEKVKIMGYSESRNKKWPRDSDRFLISIYTLCIVDQNQIGARLL